MSDDDKWLRVRSYINDLVPAEPELYAELRARTHELTGGAMILGPAAAKTLQLVAQISGARKCLEVGTFTGCSALSVALAIPADGRMVACDVSEEYTSVARDIWQKAGVADKIDLRLGAATETLQAMIDSGEAGSYDFAFIDADKTNYQSYYELCLELLRPGGLIVTDNVLWGGSVADDTNQKDSTIAIRAYNEFVASDTRTDSTIISIGDGFCIARKIG